MEKFENEFGINYHLAGVKIIFGNKAFTRDHLKDFSQQVPVQFMKQVHGNQILEFSKIKDYECDGLTTAETQSALAIKTADCLPIVIVHKQRIFAIHAGWRGLVDGILYSTKLYSEFDHNSLAFIGPHIQVDSFEVGLEVVEQAILCLNTRNIAFKGDQLIHTHKNPKKAYLNLAYLTQCQLEDLNIKKKHIIQAKVDTFTDKNWHSYRREVGNAGRNIHLVLKC